ncbi:MAG: polyphosphate polymerase domain-containing protein [Rhodothermales bacterium]
MRDEFKYVLPVDALPDVRRAIEPFVRLDEHGVGFEEVGYAVRSIYLDSARLRFYHEKRGHLQHRKKIRIRGYNEPGVDPSVFLEIKRKSNAAIAKERTMMPYDDLLGLIQTGRVAAHMASLSVEDSAVVRRAFYHMFKHDLRPTCLVVYEREAFEGRFDRTFRITLDRNLRGVMYPDWHGLYEEDGLVDALPGYFVMEVKFDIRMPAWMRQVISEFGIMQRALSKYCVCIDAFERRIDTKSAVLACAPPIRTATQVSVHVTG